MRRRSRTDEAEYRRIADDLGLDPVSVKQAVLSYFDVISREASSLPFDTEKKIYSPAKFNEYGTVWQIPGIGRLGPSYSRYLKWRVNEAKEIEMATRKPQQAKYSQEDIERYTADILAGKESERPVKKKPKEMYDKVWLVGQDGRRLARQVIPKNEKQK